MQKRKRRWLLSWLLVFVLSMNILAPSLPVYAQDEVTTTEEAQLPSEAAADNDTATEEAQVLPDPAEDNDVVTEEIQEPSVTQNEESETAQEEASVAAQAPLVMAADESTGEDVTGLIEPTINIKLKTADGVEEITNITAGVPFLIDVSFRVPTELEGAEHVVVGDWADFGLDENIQIKGGNPTIELTFGADRIGTATFLSSSKKVEIKFDGSILNDDIINVVCSFGATLTYAGTDIPEGGERNNVLILGKEFTVTNPLVPVEKSITKAGKESKDHPGEIEWTVEVNAAKGTTGISLENYVFEDDLKEVGEYVSGSFQIGGEDKVVDYTNEKLSYTFGDVTGKQTITFRTKIPGDKLIAGGTVNNTAKFGKEEPLVEKSGTATISKKTFIEKDGSVNNVEGSYNPKNQTVTWTIKVTPKGIGLANVSVTDKLPDLWEWKSAKWEWAGEAQNGITLPASIASEPIDGIYALGNGSTALINPVNLVITSKMPEKDYVGSVTTYYNKATIKSDQTPGGQDSNNKGVGVGIAGITKSSGNVDYENRQIPWTVTVDLKGQAGFDEATNPFKVYDLLIYGNSFAADSSNLGTLLEGKSSTNITARYGQKFVDGSFSGTDLTHEVKAVTVNGQVVGDLLIVSGFKADKAYPFTFNTQVLDPNIFASNTGGTVYNNASLFYGDEYLNRATAQKSYDSKVLSKGIMKADGTAEGTAENGFNYEDKTAVFKLNVNLDGYKLTDADIPSEAGGTKELGNVTVKDILPEGWSFVELSPGVKYELYTAGDNTLVSNVSDIIDGTPAFNNDTRTATFVFKELSKSYYILVKAKLSEEQYAEYGKANGEPVPSVTVENKVEMTSEGDTSWKPEGKKEVQVNTEFLNKELISPGEDSSALPKWIVYFNPYGLEKFKDGVITDTLPEGLSLKLNQDGTLADGAVTVMEYDSPNDGTFPITGGVPSSIKPSYDPLTRKLTFKPEGDKLYKIEYETLVSSDVKGNAKLKNEVVVEGADMDISMVATLWSVDDRWASATLERMGMLRITKENNENGPLEGAEFGLFTDSACRDEDKLLAAVSGSDGIASIRGIPSPQSAGETWTYYLKETKAPEGYALDPTVRKVTVDFREIAQGQLRPVVVAEGNPDTYDDGNKLTVVNYNENEVGNLTIGKTVKMGDSAREFDFTISINDNDVKGKTFPATGKANSVTFDDNGAASVLLADSENITIYNLPKDVEYTVSEADYDDEYKTTLSENGGEEADKRESSGVIEAGTTESVAFTNRGRDMGIATTAKDKETDSHTGTVSEKATIIDTVEYQDLAAGKVYTIKGILMDKATGQPLLVDGKEVTGETTFTAEEENGFVDITFTLDSSALAGTSVVVFERLYQGGKEVAVHTEINDEAQTIHYPDVSTTATDKDTASNVGKVDKKVTIVDRVKYENLVPGTEYTVKGILMDKATGKALVVDGKEIKGEKTFTATEANGFVDIEFELDSSALSGKSVVVFEDLYQGEIKVVSHADLNDEAQTIHYPNVSTTATDKDTASNVGKVDKKATIVDRVKYENLVPGTEYTVKGILMDKATGKALVVDGKEITGEKTFIAEEAKGFVDMEFELDSSVLSGKSVVVFEDLYQGEIKIVSHADLNDKAQTVHYPKIGTKAADKDTKSNKGTVGKKTTIIDKVSYENLIPGMEYVVKGILMDKNTKKPLLIGGKEVKGETTFTPTEANGSVNVEFTLDSSKLAGKSVVVFEDLYQDGVKVTSHADINDKAQTITYPKADPAGSKAVKTGDDSFNVVWIGFLGFALLLSVSVILSAIVRKRRR